MRTPTIILAITTVTFAGTTAYLARELALERERVSGTTPLGTVAAVPPTSANFPPASGSTAGISPPPASPARIPEAAIAVAAISSGRQMSEAEMKKFEAEYSRALLSQMAEPEQREELLAQRRMMTRHSFPKVDQFLGLSPDEYARFLELHALQQLEMQEKSARCTLEPNCSIQDTFRNMEDRRGQEIDSLLGAERTAKFQQYQNTMGEREAVTQLRNRMPDAMRLNDSSAEQLIAALAEERETMHRQAAQQGKGIEGFGMGAGIIYAPDESAGSLEQRYEAAHDNSQRLRERAATYLSKEQLRIFNEMQDEALLSLRSVMRQKGGVSLSAVTVAQ